MNDCLSHTRCNQLVDDRPWWPTRLLDLRDADGNINIRLIETKAIECPEPYITLSHRWGDAVFLKLLTENLDNLKAGISIDALPRTFCDAIEVTRRFKIRYLWVDSLCILQDSIDDWNREASQMSGVYQHAICNIAATGAVDSTEGLFFDKNLFAIRPCKVSIPVRNSVAEFKNVYVMDYDFWDDRIGRAPLIRRGWVVQERLLARRVLHSNRDQLYWECRERSACEIFPNAIPESMMPLGHFKDIVPNPKLDEDVSTASDPGNSKDVIWSKILSSYSRAELSNPDDREAALSGILRMLEGIFDDTCIAGLWRRSLPAQLLWWPSGSAEPSPHYRAPSWSWLSINGQVYAYRPGLIKETDRDTFPESATAELEAIDIRRSGESALSSITSGFIRLRGILVPVKWPKAYKYHTNVPLTIDGKEDLNIHGDFDHASFAVDSAGWIMQIIADRMSEEFHGSGLVLQLTPDGSFRRIGIFESADEGTRYLLSRRHREIMAGEKGLGNKTPERDVESLLAGDSISEVADHLKEEQIPPLSRQETVQDQLAQVADHDPKEIAEEQTIVII
ncbi:HET-domain-containing protein [Hyaloscypha variabilis F]|uniref:HET-domain-containing protein n=1 Tax=Hyaloscypha variabilis (strain UAMH 11265 / GT02V1 / F) TaxID=1149755 RepID=A0A2J6R8A9_HYAVF|nr:HET-domain-containing protein [Hyaloscypha variabilis F]